jgi:hypothetical protein
METKPKWKQTEFWVQVVVFAAVAIGWVVDKVPDWLAPILLAVQAGLYTWSRTVAKTTPNDAQLKQRVLDALGSMGSAGDGSGDGAGANGLPANPTASGNGKPPAGLVG